MANHRNRFPARRRFLKQSTALTASVVALPALAQEPKVPVEGAGDAASAPAQTPRVRRLPARGRREERG